MLVLVTYDIAVSSKNGARRLQQSAKICSNYGRRVQNSVYECLVDSTELQKLKHEILSVIDETQDTVRFYRLGNNYKSKVEYYGLDNGTDADGDLIFSANHRIS